MEDIEDKNKIIRKYRKTVEEDLEKDSESSQSEKDLINDSSIDSEEDEVNNFLCSDHSEALSDQSKKNLEIKEKKKNEVEEISSKEEESNSTSTNTDTDESEKCSDGENKNNNEKRSLEEYELNEKMSEEEKKEDDKEKEQEEEEEEEEEEEVDDEETPEGEKISKEKKETSSKEKSKIYDPCRKTNEVGINNKENLEVDESKRTKNDYSIINTMDSIRKRDVKMFFQTEVKDTNQWMAKYRNLISSFRKLDKEINKIVNSDTIEVAVKRSIKQHKDFLENDYKGWTGTAQRAISEFKKNIGAQVSEVNDKEYAILSKNIYEDLKEKYSEENYINFTLYLFILKYDVSTEEEFRKYLEECYLSLNNEDNVLNNILNKLIETNECIKSIGGKTGNWSEDENNYFIKAYENGKSLGDEIVVDIIKRGVNKNAEEIYEHISWYHKFMNYNQLKLKYANGINIISISDQKKRMSKDDDEKKDKIKQWKAKKREEMEMKQKEQERLKKEQMELKKKMREANLKKKQMIQEHNIQKKEQKKKKDYEGKQKNVVSEEMLQRINERNEKLLLKKVQSNVLLNEENTEKEKKINQKYTHVQSRLLNNTDDILKRIESSVETIKNIL